ncbi:unnamed protein product [Thelazia callipaeda]|uniref:UPF0506 domain-containing protein n=1 Tax=Thelazia callipaeda TaxID=103827 RepID=A0A0N5CNE0_THECL|nr:unnamed protein product [Thelazia callipaeda]
MHYADVMVKIHIDRIRSRSEIHYFADFFFSKSSFNYYSHYQKSFQKIFISVECLSCYTCESLEDCANPRIQLCSKNDECFTVAQNYDTKSNGLRKGCAPTCDRVNIVGKLCRTCDSELCNGKTGKEPFCLHYTIFK